MRVLSPGSLYYYPLTRETIQDLFVGLFSPFTRAQSSTFSVKSGFGGGGALTKFMILHVDDLARESGVPVSSETHGYVYVDPVELSTLSKEGFFRLLMERTRKSLNMQSASTDFSSFAEDIREAAGGLEIVFVLRGINRMPFLERSSWSMIRSLWIPSGRVHYLFIEYSKNGQSVPDERFRGIDDLTSQNITRFATLQERDISYSIDRWGYVLERKFSREERQEITAVSRGYPALIKACCLARARMEKEESLENDQHVSQVVGRVFGGQFLDPDTRRKVEQVLSPGEFRVFLRLTENPGDIVYRDEIASVLWPSDSTSNFSDNAISQMVRRLRSKLLKEGCNVRISTVYGKGYVCEIATPRRDQARTP